MEEPGSEHKAPSKYAPTTLVGSAAKATGWLEQQIQLVQQNCIVRDLQSEEPMEWSEC
jgi:hypothetical protein